MVAIYPLRFYNKTPLAKNLTEHNPGTVVDATSPPGTLAIPVCVNCNTGEGVVREKDEETKTQRYRCVICGSYTDWDKDEDEVAQQWADMNDPIAD